MYLLIKEMRLLIPKHSYVKTMSNKEIYLIKNIYLLYIYVLKLLVRVNF